MGKHNQNRAGVNKAGSEKESMKQRDVFFFFLENNKIDKSLAKITKRKKIFKLIKLKMTREASQQIMRKFRETQEHT